MLIYHGKYNIKYNSCSNNNNYTRNSFLLFSPASSNKNLCFMYVTNIRVVRAAHTIYKTLAKVKSTKNERKYTQKISDNLLFPSKSHRYICKGNIYRRGNAGEKQISKYWKYIEKIKINPLIAFFHKRITLPIYT